ncbi:hypothetical protein O6H91_09G075500 [Diphasiastrum complanatum]|uniref:Uncharacterized protein n=1 Tax=Diphasiastrum complanatum TaxID=34168 RepID=A0ACC2CQP2_DIPCM|nr:hypothetical protein O6H91_09G075500 [Diphasiastrum complanatum]
MCLRLSSSLQRGLRFRGGKKLSRIMDESLLPQEVPAVPLEHGARQANGWQNEEEAGWLRRWRRSRWFGKLTKVPSIILAGIFGLHHQYPYRFPERDLRPDALRDARLSLWFRSDHLLSEPHYMFLQSGMRYAFFI